MIQAEKLKNLNHIQSDFRYEESILSIRSICDRSQP